MRGVTQDPDPLVGLSTMIPKSIRDRLDALREKDPGSPALSVIVRRVLIEGLAAAERETERPA